MSRCLNCLLDFNEQNGWQEFCCPDCAKHYIARGKAKNADAIFTKWFSNPNNNRKVRMGEKEKTPSFGILAKRKISYTDGRGKNRISIIDVNVGGTIKIRPMTDQERQYTERRRGRGSFGEGHIENRWRDELPSQGGKACTERCWGDPFGRFD